MKQVLSLFPFNALWFQAFLEVKKYLWVEKCYQKDTANPSSHHLMASKNWFNFIQAKDPKTAARKIKWRLFITEFDIFIEVYQPLFSLGFSFVNLRVALRAYLCTPPSLCSSIGIHSIVIKRTLFIKHLHLFALLTTMTSYKSWPCRFATMGPKLFNNRKRKSGTAKFLG